MASDYTALYEKSRQYGQEHLLACWDQLTDAERSSLSTQIKDLDFAHLEHIFTSSRAFEDEKPDFPEPISTVHSIKHTNPELKSSWRQTGLELIAQGKLAVLLLAGGQGTRLGSSLPKGCYDIGLPSHKSLFALQAERVFRLQLLAKETLGLQSSSRIRWYIMTSPATSQETMNHFKDNNFFGLDPHQVVFFNQGQLPAFSESGKIILDTPHSISFAPDGNGGVYTALKVCGILEDMRKHGVECIDCYSVDNALVRVGDPVFAGFCWQQQAECGARVVAKAYPEEKVGVFAKRGASVQVVEYSELDPKEANAMDAATGELKYNWSNICLHYFSREFLEDVVDKLRDMGQYHIARKKISSVDGGVQGIKLELFIFDTFPLAKNVALLEVVREEEFAPVKNAPGSATDSPDTARNAILAMHKRWVVAAGGVVECDGLEISPLLSYAGEGLKSVCADIRFTHPFDERLQTFHPTKVEV